MQLSFQHLVSTKQLTREETNAILEEAQKMEIVLKAGGDDRLKGKILATLFFEPSTRTRLSFESAMQRLGGNIITAEGIQFSSMYKGETLEDTIKIVNQYADAIAMRHPDEGSAARAAAVSEIPFINAGDGPGQHPTQALLDMYTIQKERGKIEGLHVAFVGDLKYGRTARSLCYLLMLYPDMRITLISPDSLKMGDQVKEALTKNGVTFEETEDFSAGFDADILYMTRVQKERFTDMKEYDRVKDKYILTADLLKGKKVTVMHPLPRVNEITTDVDALPNAAYFRQAHNGKVVRMALLSMLLS